MLYRRDVSDTPSLPIKGEPEESMVPEKLNRHLPETRWVDDEPLKVTDVKEVPKERRKVLEEQNNVLEVVTESSKTQTNLLETSEIVLETTKKLPKKSKMPQEPSLPKPKSLPETLKMVPDSSNVVLQELKLTTETPKELPEKPTNVLEMPKKQQTAPKIVAKVPTPVLETSLTPAEMPIRVISETGAQTKSTNITDSVTEVSDKSPETLRHHPMAAEVVKEEPKAAPEAKGLPLQIQKVAAAPDLITGEKHSCPKASPTQDSESLKQILQAEKAQQQGRYDYKTIMMCLLDLLNSTS